jgi:hypothetical protein
MNISFGSFPLTSGTSSAAVSAFNWKSGFFRMAVIAFPAAII